jgi:HAD superfamily hydrolase (TIGR01509 family)
MNPQLFSRSTRPADACVPMNRDATSSGRPAAAGAHPVRGFVFDMGDVLYDATVWRRWLLKLLGRIGVHTTYRCFFQVWDHEYLRDVHRGRRDFCEAFQSFLLSVGLTRAQIDEVEAACQARRRQLEASARPLPGVKATIARLRGAGVPMAVLSDSERRSCALVEQLNRFGLRDMFDAVLSSVELEETKPAAVCYLAALERIDLSPAEAAFVGHDAEELAGARAVGMQTVAFNFDSAAEADMYLARFEDLQDLVGQSRSFAAAG